MTPPPHCSHCHRTEPECGACAGPVYLIDENTIQVWKNQCINPKQPHTDGDICRACDYRGKGARKNCCDFDDSDMEKIFRSRPVQQAPVVDDEPDLKPISNCLKREIVITPEICTKFWTYRADSGHLYHLLFDLLGREDITPENQGDALMQVLELWETRPAQAREGVLKEVLESFNSLDSYGEEEGYPLVSLLDVQNRVELIQERSPRSDVGK